MFIIFLSHIALAKAESIFKYERIDFFQEIKTEKEPVSAETNNPTEVIQEEWAEPIISPSGRVSIYVPPKEVRDFLDKPDPENARAYLAWNLKRIKKFILAQEVLRKESKELEVMKEGKNSFKPDSGYLFYFMLKGCATCEKESHVIEDIYLKHPEIRVETFAKGFSDSELDEFRFPVRQDNGMSSLFKVNSYPTIAVFNKNKQKYFLSGFIDRDRIMRLLQ
jgi:thioredoxin-related protein